MQSRVRFWSQILRCSALGTPIVCFREHNAETELRCAAIIIDASLRRMYSSTDLQLMSIGDAIALFRYVPAMR